MVQFNELRITPDGRYLVIDAEVQNLEYYDDMHLEKIQLDIFSDPKDCTAPIPSGKAITLWEADYSVTYERFTDEDKNSAKIGDTFWVYDLTIKDYQSRIINSEDTLRGIQAGAIPAYKQILAGATKHIRRIIDLEDTGISKSSLFFVYVIEDGEFAEDTPCGAKDKVLLGVVYNKALLYDNSIKAISTMTECEPSKSLIDYILRIKAFNLALSTGDYKSALLYWDNAFNKHFVSKSNCGCHGY